MAIHIGRGSGGFTLIELLVVMGIIGVMATLLFTNFAGARSRARDTQRKNDLLQVKNALRLFYNDYQAYPTALNNGINGCGDAQNDLCEWGVDTFEAGLAGTVYMNQLPQDPLYDEAAGTPSYEYTQGSSIDPSDNSFTLTATLENLSDPAIADSQERCGATPNTSTFMLCAD